MATLVFAAAGRAIGGDIGQAIGAYIGQRIDQKLLGPKGRQGPRLNDLAIQGSTYGAPIPRLYGANRVAGTVIWATELIESRRKVSAGKGQPKSTVYSYSVSFAVALSARPIAGIGRIWADGKLLRGAGGDFKTETGFRLHHGGEGQPVDPLIAAAEGIANTPAYRGLAYVVFEAMQLADYGNRIPSLSFEVFGDAGPVTVGSIISDIGGQGVEATLPETLTGFAAYGDSRRAVVETLAALTPVSATDDGTSLRLSANGETVPAAIQSDLGAATGASGAPRLAVTRRSASTIPEILSIAHYEVARDYQQGVQRARRDGGARREVRLDAPVVIAAAEAKGFAEAQLTRVWNERVEARIHLPWSRLDMRPGQILTVAGSGERWRVRALSLEKMVLSAQLVRAPAVGPLAVAADPGRNLEALDQPHGPTVFHLIDLPPLADGLADAPQLVVAAAGASAGWRQAGLLVSLDGGASWQEAGGTALPAIMGAAATSLANGSPRLEDRARSVDVALLHDHMLLENADEAGVRGNRNLAMLGDELIQFRTATPLGGNVWRLSGLNRGQRGTEWAMASHAAGERFVLLDADALAGISVPAGVAEVRVIASGISDGPMPPVRIISAPGQALVPPAPVHLAVNREANGDTLLRWKRRSRDGWRWLDGVDAPLGEETEAWRIALQPDAGAAIILDLSTAQHVYAAAQRAAHVGGGANSLTVTIRQIGRYGLSRPATVTIPLS